MLMSVSGATSPSIEEKFIETIHTLTGYCLTVHIYIYLYLVTQVGPHVFNHNWHYTKHHVRHFFALCSN